MYSTPLRSKLHTKLVLPLGFAAFLWACPQVLPARSAVRMSDSPACPVPHASEEISAAVAERCIALLQGRIEELEREAALQSADALRYRAGLEAAVDELNKLRPRRYDPHPAARRAASVDLDADARRLGSLASVRLDGRTAVVRGTFRNGTGEPVRGILVIELLREGDLTSTARYLWEIPPHAQRDYEQRFELSGYVAGVYSARAWIEH